MTRTYITAGGIYKSRRRYTPLAPGRCTEAVNHRIGGEETYRDIYGKSELRASPPTNQEHRILVRVKILPRPGHPHSAKKILNETSIKLIICAKTKNTSTTMSTSDGRYLSLQAVVIVNHQFPVEKFLEAADIRKRTPLNPHGRRITVAFPKLRFGRCLYGPQRLL